MGKELVGWKGRLGGAGAGRRLSSPDSGCAGLWGAKVSDCVWGRCFLPPIPLHQGTVPGEGSEP